TRGIPAIGTLPAYQGVHGAARSAILLVASFCSAGASRSGRRRRQQQKTSVVCSEKCGGLRGIAWHEMQVIAGFFGSGTLAARPGHRAVFFRYFKKLAQCAKLATSYTS